MTATARPGFAARMTALAGRVGLRRPRGASVLTLALEGSSLRLLRVSEGAVESWTGLPFNPRLVRGGRIEDARGLAEVIKNGLARLESRTGTTDLVAAFPSSQMVVRYLTIPRIRGVKPETIIPREARRILGAAADQQLVHWAALSATATEETYYVVAIPRAEMARFVETLQSSGLKPRRIEARPLALARAMPADDAVLLRLEATDLSVTVMVGRVPELVTRRSLEMSMAPEDLLAEITDAVQTTVAFQGSRADNRPLPVDAPLFLFGGHPQIDGALASSVQNTVGRKIRFPESPLPAPPDFPAQEYMVNLGMALDPS
jgi:hypothetical protein